MSVNSDFLGRYYTATSVGELLVSTLKNYKPGIVLDLGAGDGALTSAAAQVWKNARYFTVDIDKSAKSARLSSLYKGAFTHHVGDALALNVGEKLGLERLSADIAICNPPYIRPRWKKSFAAIIEEAGLSGTHPTSGAVSAELLFIAQNLRFLKPNGRLGIIVPDGIVAGEKSAQLRERLATAHSIEKIIELPRNIFAKTDAKAHILILAKNAAGPSEIQIQRMTLNGVLTSPIALPREQASHRLDYTYLSSKTWPQKKQVRTIRDVTIQIQRGNISSAQRKNLPYPVLHTTDIAASTISIGRNFALPKQLAKSLNNPLAERGDLLLARVGRNLQCKVCTLDVDNAAISDCIFALRIHEDYRTQVFNFLRSTAGQNSLDSATRGVGARFLTGESVLEIQFGMYDAN